MYGLLRGLHKIKQTQEIPTENPKLCATRSEDLINNKILPKIICLPDVSYVRNLQALAPYDFLKDKRHDSNTKEVTIKMQLARLTYVENGFNPMV